MFIPTSFLRKAQSVICAGPVSCGGKAGFTVGIGGAGTTERLDWPLLSGFAIEEVPLSGTRAASGWELGNLPRARLASGWCCCRR